MASKGNTPVTTATLPATMAQGQNAPIVTSTPKLAIPSHWPSTRRSAAEQYAVCKVSAKLRVQNGLSNGTSINVGKTSSTWRSRGSKGTGKNDPTFRPISLSLSAGAALTTVKIRIDTLQPQFEQWEDYLVLPDLWQNYLNKVGMSLSMLFDMSVLVLADATWSHDLLTKVAGVTDQDYARFVELAQSIVKYYGVTPSETMFDTTKVQNVVDQPETVDQPDDLDVLASLIK